MCGGHNQRSNSPGLRSRPWPRRVALEGSEIGLALTLLFKKLQVEMLKIQSLVLSLGSNRIHAGHGLHADSRSGVYAWFSGPKGSIRSVADRADGKREPKAADHNWTRDRWWSLCALAWVRERPKPANSSPVASGWGCSAAVAWPPDRFPMVSLRFSPGDHVIGSPL